MYVQAIVQYSQFFSASCLAAVSQATVLWLLSSKLALLIVRFEGNLTLDFFRTVCYTFALRLGFPIPFLFEDELFAIDIEEGACACSEIAWA